MTTSPSNDGDEDEDLRRAIALSLQDQESLEQATPAPKSEAAPTDEPKPASQDTSKVTSGLLVLDRRKMEQERLARLAKRRRDETADDDNDVKEISPPPLKRRVLSPEVIQTAASSLKEKLPFEKWAVKRTWAYGCPRTGDDIKIEEVFQRDELQLVVLSSFQWDEEWLMSKLDVGRTKLLLVAYAADDNQV